MLLPTFLEQPMALITISRMKQAPAAARYADAELLSLISGASLVVEEYCGRTFWKSSVHETYSGMNKNQLFLSMTPVDSVAAVLITDESDVVDTYTSGSMLFNKVTGELQFKPSADLTFFPGGFQNVEVRYTGGYTEIPIEVQDAVIGVALAMGSQSSTSNELALGADASGDYAYGHREVAKTYGLCSLAVKSVLDKFVQPCGGSIW